MTRKLFFKELNNSIYLGLKFGFFGSIISFILQAIWGSFNAVSYTIITGFLIGFFIGLFEISFSHSKISRFPYSLLLFIRAIIYFVITLVCVYLLFRVYLGKAGYSVKLLQDPLTYAQIENLYFLANINTIYILIFAIVTTNFNESTFWLFHFYSPISNFFDRILGG